MTNLTLKDITAEEIVSRSVASGEPAWLTERRREAWDYFAQAIPPEWRRTNLTGLNPEILMPADSPQGTAIQWDAELAQTGAIFTTMAAALRSHEELIRAKMDSAVDPLEHKFSALRAALWQDGAFLYVPKGVSLDLPLRVCYTLSASNQAIFPRTLVILEDNASVTLIEEFTSQDHEQAAMAGPVTEILAGPGSSIRFASVQHWGSSVYHIGAQKIVLGRDASAEWTSVALGGQVQHIEAETRLEGNGSQVNWLGATFASETQNLVTAPWLRHVGYNAESFMQFKTVVNDTAYSVFDGMIKIEHESKATSTRLEEHALHLSPNARNDSIPGLKIDTNDVLKGGHASTSGDVDDMQLFYMQARGIKRDEAKRMIVMGFFEPALNRITVEDLRDEITGIIESKI
ncbi:Fe-S cluster assembly protein SufD [Oscillochloris sp. ZM17-4]|uniref:Fe-S cluster assembly protein SufD n=1 Tax=Oscillochloris sp. ZM17-4 TaxID=2866714 RepID=UPI001C72EAEF|nr:Fe-S cluster assembly protein SufD [Oscillochloris sp. ZM17-4]MBX0328501.1 Fe-S cluster assembly protein SufD [Oscillochloris sp. ZM17-4]